MSKVLAINRYTGIDHRSSIGTPDHPLVNGPAPPTIADLHSIFVSDGVPLAVSAARQALAEARLRPEQVTHMVSTTCTDSANPGYDHLVARALGLGPRTEKVLLHGVGCSGGLAALRTAANLALGHAARGIPARILCVALEISTTMVRSELDSIDRLQETRIGVALFSDCASAAVLSNGLGEPAEDGAEDGAEGSEGSRQEREPVYELLGWDHRIIPETEKDLGFDVDPQGWKVVLSTRVPKLTEAVLRPSFDDLISSTAPLLPPPTSKTPSACTTAAEAGTTTRQHQPADFDWAMHPGGATILSGAERALGITPEHMRASYDTYIRHGNSSSATIFSVMDRLRHAEMDAMAPGGAGPKEHVVACAFGPGIAVEMAMLRRPMGRGARRRRTAAIVQVVAASQPVAQQSGLLTPPETESDDGSTSTGGARSEDGDDVGSKMELPPTTDAPLLDGSQQKDHPIREAFGDQDFISEALEAVELD